MKLYKAIKRYEYEIKPDVSYSKEAIATKNEYYYRVTYSDIGIYEALKQNASKEEWDSFLKSDKAKWLPKPNCEYKSTYNSYFTELGYQTFMNKTKKFMEDVLDKKKIKVSKYTGIDLSHCVYKDKYQIVIDQNTALHSVY